MRPAASIALYAIALLSVGACSQEQPDYGIEEFKGIDRTQWITVARREPLDKRLSLYDELYKKSGHPPDTIIARSFDQEGDEAFDIVINRIGTSQDFVRYWPVLLALDTSDKFSACDTDNLARLKKKIQQINIGKSIEEHLNMSDCSLASTG